MITRRNSLDSPLDYRELWAMLDERIHELIEDQAQKALHSDDDTEIRRYQGAYRFGYSVLSVMTEVIEAARASKGPLRQARDGTDL